MQSTPELTGIGPTDEVDTEQMRAIVQYEYGSVEVLELRTVARPRIEADEVLIEVHAAGVDRGVWHLMTGLPYLVRLAGFGIAKPKNPVVGLDVAGRVVAIGAEVTRFQPGDEVFGIAKGSYADYAAADENKLAIKPSGTTFEQAAVSAISGITALEALIDVGKLQADQSVLIVGASGGVGTFAVQLAKAVGAVVTAVNGPASVDTVRSLGADNVIDHTTEDFTDTDSRYDLILDIGGRNSISRLRSVLTAEGTLVIVGGEDGNRFTGGVGRQVRAMILSPFIAQRLAMFISSEDHVNIERLAEFMEAGTVIPRIGRRFELADAADAISEMVDGPANGKLVIVVRPDDTQAD